MGQCTRRGSFTISWKGKPLSSESNLKILISPPTSHGIRSPGLQTISPTRKSPPRIELSFIVFTSSKYTQQNNEKDFHEQKLSLNRYFIMIIKKWLVIMKLLYLSNVKVYIRWTYYPVFGVLRAYEVQRKERQLGSTDLYLNRLQIRISLTKK